jgi:uncharacterized radical SAM superfamily Fe-S cluster-containing enzyme
VCLARIPARLERRGADVFLAKTCPEHGAFESVVWRGEPGLDGWTRPKTPSRPDAPRTGAERGCPFDCGLCPEHGQHTCTALVEITWRCDLGCPVCFASSGRDAPPDLSMPRIAATLEAVRAASGPCNIQFSGGEPSLHPELETAVRTAASMGFGLVQLNTNGLRAAREPDFAPRLAEAGLGSVFLQFDGVTDAAFRSLRGRDGLLEQKLLAVERFAAAGVGVVLVPTVAPGVNDRQLGDLLRLAASLSPGVRGVHFQPVSYFGRHPGAMRPGGRGPEDAARITLPELMRGLEAQTGGLVRATDFLPPGCEHARCSFHANYLVREDGGLQRLSASRAGCGCSSEEKAAPGAPPLARLGADQAKAFVRRQWAAPEGAAADRQAATPPQTPAAPGAAPATRAPFARPDAAEAVRGDDLDRFLARARTHILSVSAMAFQDAWTLDLERLKGCCIHVALPDGRLVPFCAYNLTAADGAPLYRERP